MPSKKGCSGLGGFRMGLGIRSPKLQSALGGGVGGGGGRALSFVVAGLYRP